MLRLNRGTKIGLAIVTLVYLWFPYMAIPVYAAVAQIP